MIEKIELPVEEMIKDKKNGLSQRQLEVKYGVSMTTISARIKEYCEATGEKEPKGNLTGKIELPVEDIIKKWRKKIKISDIAVEYGVSSTNISKRIDEYCQEKGIKRPKKKKKIKKERGEKKPYKDIPVEEIITQRENGVEITELSEKYVVSGNTIERRIDRYYEERKINKPKILKSASVITEYLKKGLTPEQIREIAKQSGVIIPDEIMKKGIEANEKKKNELNEGEER